MTARAPTLYEAVRDFLGPLTAEYGRIIDEGHDDMPVEINLGGYVYKTTLKDLKALDRAHHRAFDAKLKRAKKGAML